MFFYNITTVIVIVTTAIVLYANSLIEFISAIYSLSAHLHLRFFNELLLHNAHNNSRKCIRT